MAIKPENGMTICNTWDITDHQGERISVGFVARACPETQDDGGERLICRAMNWRAECDGPSFRTDRPGAADPRQPRSTRRVPGAGRPEALDAAEVARRPRPVLRLARGIRGEPVGAPGRRGSAGENDAEFATGATSGVLRMRGQHGGWTPVHVTVHRVELDKGVYAGLVAFRLPTHENSPSRGSTSLTEPTRSNRGKAAAQRESQGLAAGDGSPGPALARPGPGPPGAPQAHGASTVTTTSSPSTVSDRRRPIAPAITDACAHARGHRRAARPQRPAPPDPPPPAHGDAR